MIKELSTLDAKAVAEALNEMFHSGTPVVLLRHSLMIIGGSGNYIPSSSMPLIQGMPIVCVGDTVTGSGLNPQTGQIMPLSGTVVTGHPTVLLNGRPVAHVGGTVVHTLGTAVISEGLFTPVSSSDVQAFVGLGF